MRTTSRLRKSTAGLCAKCNLIRAHRRGEKQAQERALQRLEDKQYQTAKK
ncbi:MAG: hypothetical protein IJ764_03470 [Bacteroidales bacterium]|nr:hypothetical protein [Bacteroidales bacterium]